MAAIINSSSLKFYAENTFSNEVTGGTSAGDTLYPKLDETFQINYNGNNIMYRLPFSGRGPVIVNKTFTCGASTKPFLGSLIGREYKPQDDGMDMPVTIVSWTGQGVCEKTGFGTVKIPKYAGTLTIKTFANSTGIQVNSQGDDVIVGTLDSILLNGEGPYLGNQATDLHVLTGDPGLLEMYEIVLVFTFPENTGVVDRQCVRLYFEDLGYLYINQGSEALTLSTASITLDKSTGVGSSVVTVAADANWTIS